MSLNCAVDQLLNGKPSQTARIYMQSSESNTQLQGRHRQPRSVLKIGIMTGVLHFSFLSKINLIIGLYGRKNKLFDIYPEENIFIWWDSLYDFIFIILQCAFHDTSLYAQNLFCLFLQILGMELYNCVQAQKLKWNRMHSRDGFS